VRGKWFPCWVKKEKVKGGGNYILDKDKLSERRNVSNMRWGVTGKKRGREKHKKRWLKYW